MPSTPSATRANGATTRVPWISTTADALADVRQRCWCGPQLAILDLLIDALGAEYEQLVPAFDNDMFHHQAGFKHGHLINQP